MSGAPVTWASSAPSVASVSSAGLVTAVADGTATITATSGSAMGTVPVGVGQVAATVTLSPNSLVLAGPGDAATVTALVTDAGGSEIASPILAWSSDNEAIATVSSSGLVTAVAAGAATISVGATSGDQTITQQLPVTVNLAPATACLPYDPNLGTLPSGQEWLLHASGTLLESNYTLDTAVPSEAVLVQGSTAPDGNVQAYRCTKATFNFGEDEVTLTAELKVFSSTLTHIPDPDNLGFNRAGWAIQPRDDAGWLVTLYIGESGLFILGENKHSSGLVAFNSTDGFHTYEFVINSTGASLFVDGGTTALAFLDRSEFRPLATNLSTADFGDLTIAEHSNTALRGFSIVVN